MPLKISNGPLPRRMLSSTAGTGLTDSGMHSEKESLRPLWGLSSGSWPELQKKGGVCGHVLCVDR